jgi:hypothetical protein
VKDGIVTVHPVQSYQLIEEQVDTVDAYYANAKTVHSMLWNAKTGSAFHMANGLIAPNVSFEFSVRGEWNQKYPTEILNLFDNIDCV